MLKTKLSIVAASIALASASAVAGGSHYTKAAGDSALGRIKLHGFATAGAFRSNVEQEYYIPGRGLVRNRTNFGAGTLAGINVSAALNNQWSVTMQSIATGDDRTGSNAFDPKLQWAFVKYNANDHASFRLGRFRAPQFMYSETQMVGNSLPWQTVPAEVYGLAYFKDMNGVDMTYHASVGNGWNFTLHPFYGSADSKVAMNDTGYTSASLSHDSIMGMRVGLAGKHVAVSGGFSQSKVTMTAPVSVTHKKVKLWNVGAKANYNNFLLEGEFAKRKDPSNLPEQDGFYGTLGYHFNKWMPHVTYAKLKTKNASVLSPSSMAQDQHSVTLGVNYRFNSHVVGKASVSRIKTKNGTTGLFATAPSKDKVYLYGVSVDAVF